MISTVPKISGTKFLNKSTEEWKEFFINNAIFIVIFAIILQGADLSLGRSVGFAAVISASLLQRPDYPALFYPEMGQLPLFVPMLVAIAVCVIFSAINGYVVVKFLIHPFLATMGMMITLYGILSIYFASGAPGPQPIGGHDVRYTELAVALDTKKYLKKAW